MSYRLVTSVCAVLLWFLAVPLAWAQPTDPCACSTPQSCGDDDECVHPSSGDPVDLASGEMFLPLTLISVDAGYGPIVATLGYSSRAAVAAEGGPGLPVGWTQSYSRRLEISAGRVLAVSDEGETTAYVVDPSDGGRFVPVRYDFRSRAASVAEAVAADEVRRLGHAEDEGGVRFRWSHPNGSSDFFDGLGRLVSVEDAFGNRTDVILHQLSGRADLLFETIRGCANGVGFARTYRRTTSVSGTAEWRLVSVAELSSNRPDGEASPLREYTFAYDSNGHLASIRSPLHSAASAHAWILETDVAHRVTRSCDWGGACTQYEYEGISDGGHQVLAQVYPSGVRVQLVRQAHPDSEPAWTLELQYSAPGRSERHFRRFLHDSHGRIVRSYAMDSTSVFAASDYDADGRLVRDADPFGRETRYSRDPRGYVAATVADPQGLAATTRYAGHDGLGRPRVVVDPEGRRVEIDYLGPGPVREVRAFDGPRVYRTTYEYDASGRLTRVSTPTGYVQTLEYDATHSHPTRVIHADSRLSASMPIVTAYSLDWRGEVVGEVDVRGVEWQYTRDAIGRITSIVLDPVGARTRFEVGYDGTGRPRELRADAGGVDARWQWRYSNAGERGVLAETTSPEGDVVSYSYDVLGRRTETRWRVANDDGSDRVERVTYSRVEPTGGLLSGLRIERSFGEGTVVEGTFLDDAGYVAWVSDGRGSRRDFEIDALGRVARTTVGVSATVDGAPAFPVATRFDYDRSGRLVSSRRGVGADAVSVEIRYDGLGRVAGWTDGEGRATQFDEQDFGRRIRITRGAGHPTESSFETIEYDAFGRETAREVVGREGASRVAFSYGTTVGDRNAWDVRSIDGPGPERLVYAYDARGGLASVSEGPTGEALTRYGYDGLMRLSTITTPRGLERRLQYDRADRLVAVVETAGTEARRQSRVYRSHGALAETVDFDGTRTAYSYDSRGRLAGVDRGYLGASGAPPAAVDVAFRYLANSLLAGMTDSEGTTEYAYDAGNRLARSSRGGRYVTYRYSDATGELVEQGIDGAVEWQYERDRSGRVTAIGVPTARFRSSVRYRADGTVDSVTRWTDRSADRLVSRRSEFDAAGLPAALETAAVGAGARRVIAGHRLERRAGAVVSDVEPSGRDRRYTRDSRGQLAGVVTRAVAGASDQRVSYQYDQDGHRVLDEGGSRAVDAFGRMVGDDVEYDRRGNLTRFGGARFGYDEANQLIRSERDGVVFNYAYDGRGRLVRRTAGGRSTQFIHDEALALPVVLVAHEASVAETRYVHGPDGPMAERTAGGALRHLVVDRQGSVEAVIDAELSVVRSMQYAPFGARVGVTGLSDSRFGFQGMLANPDGTVYARARTYLPGAGRFLQRDSFAGDPGTPLSLNRVMFAQGDPTRYRDPSGFVAEPDDWGETLRGAVGDFIEGRAGVDESCTTPACILGQQSVGADPAGAFALPSELSGGPDLADLAGQRLAQRGAGRRLRDPNGGGGPQPGYRSRISPGMRRLPLPPEIEELGERAALQGTGQRHAVAHITELAINGPPENLVPFYDSTGRLDALGVLIGRRDGGVEADLISARRMAPTRRLLAEARARGATYVRITPADLLTTRALDRAYTSALDRAGCAWHRDDEGSVIVPLQSE